MIIIRSAVYAGIVSNVIAIMVCFIFGEHQYIMGKTANITMWLLTYMVHKKKGTW